MSKAKAVNKTNRFPSVLAITLDELWYQNNDI